MRIKFKNFDVENTKAHEDGIVAKSGFYSCSFDLIKRSLKNRKFKNIKNDCKCFSLVFLRQRRIPWKLFVLCWTINETIWWTSLISSSTLAGKYQTRKLCFYLAIEVNTYTFHLFHNSTWWSSNNSFSTSIYRRWSIPYKKGKLMTYISRQSSDFESACMSGLIPGETQNYAD